MTIEAMITKILIQIIVGRQYIGTYRHIVWGVMSVSTP